MALMMAASAARLKRGRPDPARARRFDVAALALIGVPPFAFVTGLYGLMRGFFGPEAAGFGLVPLVNALTALPFVYRLVAPAIMAAAEQHGRLAVMLRLEGRTYWLGVVWPAAARPVMAGAALAAALSLGDYGVIALFGGRDLVTLPYVLADRMGAYRMDEAAAIALLMLVLAGGLSLVGERLARSSAGASPSVGAMA
jgi:thiamine transport system permease protein